MLTISSSLLQSLAVHYIHDENEIIFSDSVFQLDTTNLKDLLSSYFLSGFKEMEFFNFSHDTDIKYNEVFSFCQEIFNDDGQFFQGTKNIVKHLASSSKHSNIKSGEIFISKFRQLLLENEVVEAIVIIKAESKKNFITVNESLEIQAYSGLDLSKIDKGCIVFNLNESTGYKVFIIDKTNKENQAQYWRDTFLKVKPEKDAYHFTNNFLKLTKQFITDTLPNEQEISKAEQVDLLNKSVNYFKGNEVFNVQEFENEIFENANTINSFRKFGSAYLDSHDIDIADTFEISDVAVKKQQKIFKSVLKLDRNFHIYIHGNNELIEKGFDERSGKHYYKIYFDKET